MRILGVLFLASAMTAFGGGIVLDNPQPCSGVSALSDIVGSYCGVGPFTMFGVYYQTPIDPNTFNPATPATAASDIGVFIGYDGATMTVNFSGMFLYPSDNLTSPEVAEYRIGYTIDPPPPVILGWDEEIDFGDNFRAQLLDALVGPPNVQVITLLCVDGSFDGDTCYGPNSEQPGPIVLDPGQLFGGVTFANPTNRVQVIHRILVTEDVNLNLRNTAPLASVPEPETWVLMGAGLVLVWVGWRKRRPAA